MALTLLDTSVAVDHLRGYDPAVVLLGNLLSDDGGLVSSEVVRFELLAGVRTRDEDPLEVFLATVDWLPVTEEVARQAAAFARRYRASHSGIDAADYLVAATAEVLDAALITTRRKHFPMFGDLATVLIDVSRPRCSASSPPACRLLVVVL